MSRGNYDYNSDINFKTLMITSKLCEYSDAYVHIKTTIKVPNTSAQCAAVNNTNKKLIFQNLALFTSYMSITNNTQVY